MKTRTKAIVAALGFAALAATLALMFTAEYKVKHGAHPPSRTPASGADLIDQLLERLEFGNIAFNAPGSVNLHETAVIELKLSMAKPMEELKRTIEAQGVKEGARIRVSERMEARLSGPNFVITTVMPEIQAVSRRELTEWKWEVKPKTEGRHRLHLTLSALLTVNGVSTPRVVRTFDRMIEVDVTLPQRIGAFVEKNWQWLWAAAAAPLVTWLWKRGKSAKQNAKPKSKPKR